MGFGGALMWTGLANDLHRHYPEKKIVFVYNSSLKDILNKKRPSDHIIYKHNPHIHKVMSKWEWRFYRRFNRNFDYYVVDLDDAACQYWHGSNSKQMFLKSAPHAISIMAMRHGIGDSEMQPVLELGDDEKQNVDRVLSRFGLQVKKFICFEPNSKMEWTPNRAWFPEYWDELITLLAEDEFLQEQGIQIVRLGVGKSDPADDRVMDLAGESSFRECSGLLKASLGFLSTEGGLVHLAVASKIPSVVIMSGYNPKEMISYPSNINLYHRLECSGCGLINPCSLDRECMRKITPADVHRALIKMVEGQLK